MVYPQKKRSAKGLHSVPPLSSHSFLSSLFLVFTFFTLVSLITFVSLFATPATAVYEENVREGIFVIQPENQYLAPRTLPTLLQSEDLAFFACIEDDDTPVRLSVLCSDNNNFRDIDAIPWGSENCFLGALSLDTFACREAMIIADYVRDDENLRLTKPIRINRITGSLQRVLDAQFVDGGWSSALDTAYALFSLKPFDDVFTDRIDAGLRYLKENRDEVDKCWPEERCQVSTTAAIAFLLSRAEYDDESRVLRDATTYLQKSMQYLESGETYTITIIDHPTNVNNSINTSCVYGYNNQNTSITLARFPVQHNYTVTPAYSDTVRAVCTENILARVTSSTRGQLISYAGDNLTYTIPGPCWTVNNENVTCDLRTTALATAAPLPDERKEAASTWLAAQLRSTATGLRAPQDDLMNAGIIATVTDVTALPSEKREQLIDDLLFRQTNDGSWNVTVHHYNNSYYEPTTLYRSNFSHVLADNVTAAYLYTGYIVHALLSNDFSRDREEILDAERWASNNEGAVTVTLTAEQAALPETVTAYEKNVTDILSDPKRNAMALSILQQNTRPFLKSNPRIIVLDKKEITVDITNPTTFALDNLEYVLPPNLQSLVSIEEKDTFAPFSFRRITISQVQNVSVEEFGYLRIGSGSDEYAKIPFIVTGYPSLNISIPREMTVFGSSTIIMLEVTKSGHNFSCSITWNEAGISTVSSFSIERSGTFSLPAQFTQSGTEEKIYSGTITCKAVTSTFTFPFSILVNRFLTRPISVSSQSLTINGTDLAPGTASFTVKNLLDESIDVIVSLRDPNATEIDFSEYFINLYPGESRVVTVSTLPVIGENLSLVNAVLVKSFNIEERIPLTVELIAETPVERPLWMVVAVGVFLTGLLGLLGYFAYDNRKRIATLWKRGVRKESYYEKIRHDVEEYEKKEQAIAIKNIVAILKMQGLGDTDIRARLREQGFTDEEVTQALKMKIESPSKQDTRSPNAEAKAGAPGAQTKDLGKR
jgi:hypothetical protein